MRRRLLAALALLSAGTAAAAADPLPFDGRWGLGPEACALRPGESDMVPTVIADGTVRYYESTCRIERVEPVGGGDGSAWRVSLACEGEGETWRSESIFALHGGAGAGPRQWIDIDLGTGFVIVREACGGAAE